jgi:ABC-type multidrug transport system ATPase subunit
MTVHHDSAASWLAQSATEAILVIEVLELTKRYGNRLAVNELTFAVRPGVVTGFLGPNGSGKSTTCA